MRFHRSQSTGLSVEQRFWRLVDKTPTCWNWLANKIRGYGQFTIKEDQKISAHKFSYQLAFGAVPEGKQLDHTCRNHSCVNPAHLEPVTCRENILRGTGFAALNSQKSLCPRGHEYTEANTRISNGKRHCKACGPIHKKNFRARRQKAFLAEWMKK